LNINILNEFRHALYQCFESARDSLFNCVDALLTETQAQSLIELSLSIFFERKWPSLYEAFEDGGVDRAKLRQLFAEHVPDQETEGEWLVVGVDASNIARPQSPTAEDRSCLFVHNLPECTKPITYGWQFSMLAVLPLVTSSWCYVLDCLRSETEQTAAQVAADQLAALSKVVAQRMLVVADRYYGSAAFITSLEGTQAGCDALLRIKADRVFYRQAPPPTGKRGAPRKDGPRFKCSDPSTHSRPDRTYQSFAADGQLSFEVVGWDNLHVRQARAVKLSVMRVTHYAATGKRGDPRISWFMWYGPQPLDLAMVAPTYRRRFSLEHSFRFQKQDLLWEQAHLRTPQQFQLWTDVVAMVVNQLVLAAPLGQAELRLWENKRREVSPQQVRRGMAAILAKLGTPAKPPKPRGKSAGRKPGTVVGRAKRFSVVKKSSKNQAKAKISA
jgi:hypothetical protein